MTAVPAAADAGHQGQLEKPARRGTASVVGAGLGAIFGVLLVVIVTHGFSPGRGRHAVRRHRGVPHPRVGGTPGHGHGARPVAARPARVGARGRPPRTLVVSAVPVLALSLGVAVTLYAAAPTLARTWSARTPRPRCRSCCGRSPWPSSAARYDLVLAATRGIGRCVRRCSWRTSAASGPGSGRAGGLPHRGGALALAPGLVAALRGGPGTGRRLVAPAFAARITPGGPPTPWRTCA